MRLAPSVQSLFGPMSGGLRYEVDSFFFICSFFLIWRVLSLCMPMGGRETLLLCSISFVFSERMKLLRPYTVFSHISSTLDLQALFHSRMLMCWIYCLFKEGSDLFISSSRWMSRCDFTSSRVTFSRMSCSWQGSSGCSPMSSLFSAFFLRQSTSNVQREMVLRSLLETAMVPVSSSSLNQTILKEKALMALTGVGCCWNSRQSCWSRLRESTSQISRMWLSLMFLGASILSVMSTPAYFLPSSLSMASHNCCMSISVQLLMAQQSSMLSTLCPKMLSALDEDVWYSQRCFSVFFPTWILLILQLLLNSSSLMLRVQTMNSSSDRSVLRVSRSTQWVSTLKTSRMSSLLLLVTAILVSSRVISLRMLYSFSSCSSTFLPAYNSQNSSPRKSLALTRSTVLRRYLAEKSSFSMSGPWSPTSSTLMRSWSLCSSRVRTRELNMCSTLILGEMCSSRQVMRSLWLLIRIRLLSTTSCTFPAFSRDRRSLLSDTLERASPEALRRVVFSQQTIMDSPTTWMSLMLRMRSPPSPKWLTLWELKMMVQLSSRLLPIILRESAFQSTASNCWCWMRRRCLYSWLYPSRLSLPSALTLSALLNTIISSFSPSRLQMCSWLAYTPAELFSSTKMRELTASAEISEGMAWSSLACGYFCSCSWQRWVRWTLRLLYLLQEEVRVEKQRLLRSRKTSSSSCATSWLLWSSCRCSASVISAFRSSLKGQKTRQPRSAVMAKRPLARSSRKAISMEMSQVLQMVMWRMSHSLILLRLPHSRYRSPSNSHPVFFSQLSASQVTSVLQLGLAARCVITCRVWFLMITVCGEALCFLQIEKRWLSCSRVGFRQQTWMYSSPSPSSSSDSSRITPRPRPRCPLPFSSPQLLRIICCVRWLLSPRSWVMPSSSTSPQVGLKVMRVRQAPKSERKMLLKAGWKHMLRNWMSLYTLLVILKQFISSRSGFPSNTPRLFSTTLITSTALLSSIRHRKGRRSTMARTQPLGRRWQSSRRGLGRWELARLRLFCSRRMMFSAGRGMRQKQRNLLVRMSHSVSAQLWKSRISSYTSFPCPPSPISGGTSRTRLPMYPCTTRPLPPMGSTTKDCSRLMMPIRFSLRLAFRMLSSCSENFSSRLVAAVARTSRSSALLSTAPSSALLSTLRVLRRGRMSSGSQRYQQGWESPLRWKSEAMPISSGWMRTARTYSLVTTQIDSSSAPRRFCRKTSSLSLVVRTSTPCSASGMMQSLRFSSMRTRFSPISRQSSSTSPLDRQLSCWLQTYSLTISQLRLSAPQYRNTAFSCSSSSWKLSSRCTCRGRGLLCSEAWGSRRGRGGRGREASSSSRSPARSYRCNRCDSMYLSTSTARSTTWKSLWGGCISPSRNCSSFSEITSESSSLRACGWAGTMRAGAGRLIKYNQNYRSGLVLVDVDVPVGVELVVEQLHAAEAVPVALRRLVGVEPRVAVGVAVGVLAVLALQQPLEVVVPPADVARLVHRVVEPLVQPRLRHLPHPLAVTDRTETRTAVGAAVGELAALQDAAEAEAVAAPQAPDLPLAQLLQRSQADRALGAALVPPLQLHLVAHRGQPPQPLLQALRAGHLPHEHHALALLPARLHHHRLPLQLRLLARLPPPPQAHARKQRGAVLPPLPAARPGVGGLLVVDVAVLGPGAVEDHCSGQVDQSEPVMLHELLSRLAT